MVSYWRLIFSKALCPGVEVDSEHALVAFDFVKFYEPYLTGGGRVGAAACHAVGGSSVEPTQTIVMSFSMPELF